MAKNSINLLQAELLPKQAAVTLPRVVLLWSVVFLFMLSWAFLNQYQVSTLSAKHVELSQTKSKQTKLLAQLQDKIKANRASSKVIEELALLKSFLKNKNVLLKELTDPTHTSVAGFASSMTELSMMHHKDISLQNVNITYQDLTFSGVARTPEAVPAWLAKFETSKFLSGKSFINFSLNENEEKLTEFLVSSKVNAGNANE
ncbi:MAG: Tfp pilus assembly protein PilN [Colwellia sp.]|jgi:Tfp pilus assembly protein PilN